MCVRAHTCVSATRGERWRRSHGHTVGDEADEGVGEGAAASGTPVLARRPSPDAPGAPGGGPWEPAAFASGSLPPPAWGVWQALGTFPDSCAFPPAREFTTL